MPIIHITGPAKSGKSLMGNSMRNTQISNGKGALLVDDTQEGEARYLLEKLIDGDHLGAISGDGPAIPRPAKDVNWKPEPAIIFVGDKIKLLDEFEKIVPGFTKMFGPVRSLDLA